MALKPPPRMQPPPVSGQFGTPEVGTDDGNPPTNSQVPESQSDPGALEDTRNILLITAASRALAKKYPTAVPEVQMINDAVQKLQMKITQVQPPAQVAAPPQ